MDLLSQQANVIARHLHRRDQKFRKHVQSLLCCFPEVPQITSTAGGETCSGTSTYAVHTIPDSEHPATTTPPLKRTCVRVPLRVTSSRTAVPALVQSSTASPPVSVSFCVMYDSFILQFLHCTQSRPWNGTMNRLL